MVLINNIIRPHFLFILLFSISIISCNKKYQPLFAPTSISAEVDYALPSIAFDQDILATLVTKVLLDEGQYKIEESLTPVEMRGINTHSQDGPFFLQNGKVFAIVASNKDHLDSMMPQLREEVGNKKVVFLTLIEQKVEAKLTLSKEVEEVNVQNSSPVFSASNDGKIKLTPENVAAALSSFDQWEGVHYDEERQELTFFGSDKATNPQISAGDLITAYNAIFAHEAAGEALFVDMDFAGSDSEYLVTFGGGFEDTRMGRVLLSADLMLKALSSGIDPWTKVDPLLQDWCGNRVANEFRLLFCQYLKNLVYRSENKKKQYINSIKEKFSSRSKQAQKVFELSLVGGDQSCINYILRSNSEHRKKKILSEIAATGRFKINSYSSCGMSDKSSTLEWVEGIFSLNSYEKDILSSVKELDYESHKILYSLITLPSPDSKYFLDSNSNRKVEELFDVLFEIFPQLSDLVERTVRQSRTASFFGGVNIFDEDILSDVLNTPNLEGAMVFVNYLSENQNFAKAFLSMSKIDQLTLAYISSEALVNKEFARMISDLQYHHPMCSTASIPNEVRSLRDAYVRFVCTHLSKTKRTYLAKLIRNTGGKASDFKTNIEIIFDKGLSLPDTARTIRYWFHPGNNVLFLSKDYNTFIYNQPNMEARAEELNSRRGPYEAVEYNEDELPGINENLRYVNKNYKELSSIFPTLKELNNVVKLLAFFRWIRYYHYVDFDLSEFSMAVNYGTPTERIYPIYETVVALPDGTMLRSVGGVDLHSNTQVSINQGKIDEFLGVYDTKNNQGRFTFEGHQFNTSAPLKTEPVLVSEDRTEFENDKGDQLITKTHAGTEESILLKNGQLQWSYSNYTDVFEDQILQFTNFSGLHSKPFISTWSSDGHLLELWKIQPEAGTISIQKEKIRKSHNLGQFHALVKSKFSELLALGVSSEAIWKALSMDLENARMIKKEDEIVFSYRVEGEEHHLHYLPRAGIDGSEIKSISSQTSSEWLAQYDLFSRNVIGLQLESSVSTDNLYVDELGMKNDSLLSIKLYGQKQHSLSMFDWRKVLNDQFKLPVNINESNIIGPVKAEYMKGSYKSYELTNRPFMVESITGLRALYGTNKRFALTRSTEYIAHDEHLSNLWKTPSKRIFLVDQEGFSDHNIASFLYLADEYPDKFHLLPKGKTGVKVELDEQLGESLEVIWVSNLSQSEIQRKLEGKVAENILKNAERLRVLNLNNSVYDLGYNIFTKYPDLRLVGAHPVVIDFETVYPVVEQMLTSEAQELDQQLSDITERIRKTYRAQPTPQRLRIARYLKDLNVSWEEVAPLNPPGTKNVYR